MLWALAEELIEWRDRCFCIKSAIESLIHTSHPGLHWNLVVRSDPSEHLEQQVQQVNFV